MFVHVSVNSHWGEGVGGIYFCQGFLSCMMPSMDGWMESFTKNDQDILYYL
jgi:hypothetical protein